MGRMNRLIELDRTRSRNIVHEIPSNSAHYPAGTWTATFDSTNNSTFHLSSAFSTNLAPAIVVEFGHGLFCTSDTANTAEGEAARGPRINSITMIYAVTGNALDAGSVSLDTLTYTNVAAPTKTNRPVTGSVVLTVTADPDNPSVTTFPVTTPFVLAGNTRASFQITLDGNAANSQVRFYGIRVNADVLL